VVCLYEVLFFSLIQRARIPAWKMNIFQLCQLFL